MNFSAGSARAVGLEALVALGALTAPMAVDAQVTGRVVVRVVAQGTDAHPVEGATVSVASTGVAAVTGRNGSTTLTGLAPGRHALEVSALGFALGTVDAEITNGRTLQLTVRLEPEPIPLEGLAVESALAAPLPGGVAVEVSDLGPTVPDLAAAVDRIPGATVVRSGGPGAPARVQLRGSASSQVLVLLDGVPINSPVTGVADLSTVDLSSLERVVVLPGSRSSRYGARALGGVILLETRRPVRRMASITAGVASWEGRELSGTAAWPAGDRWILSTGARWDRAEGDFAYEVPAVRGGGESTRANARHERLGADMRVERSGRVATTLRLHGSRLDRGSPGGVVQPSLTGYQRHERYGGTADATVGDANRGASARLGLQWQNATYADSAPPFGSPYDAATDVAESRISADAWTDVEGARFRAGVEASRMDVSSTSITRDELAVIAGGAWARTETTLVGDFLRVDVGAGIRVDRHDLVDGHPVSPTIDVAFTHGSTTLSTSWARGFSPPTVGDLFFQEGVLVEPNPDLLPERVRNEFTVSASQSLTSGPHSAELRLSVYDADVDDMILWFPDFRFVWSPTNFDVTRSGVEAGAQATLSLLGADHTISGNAAWSRVEYRGGTLSGQVAYRPDFTADASLAVSIPGAVLTPTWRHVGERRSAPGSALNTLSPYDVVDVGLTLPFAVGSTTTRLDLLASNVFDEHAALLVDYPLPGRGWSMRLRLIPDR